MMPSPTSTPSPTPLFNLPFLTNLDPVLAVALHVIAVLGALYGFARFIGNANHSTV